MTPYYTVHHENSARRKPSVAWPYRVLFLLGCIRVGRLHTAACSLLLFPIMVLKWYAIIRHLMLVHILHVFPSIIVFACMVSLSIIVFLLPIFRPPSVE